MEQDIEKAEVLAGQAAAGDKAALDELFSRFAGMLHKAAYQPQLRSFSEEALAEAGVSFLQAVHSYDMARGVPFCGYAKAKVYGDLRSLLRRERRRWLREFVPQEESGELSFWDRLESPDDELRIFEMQSVLRAGLARLPEAQRAVVERLFFAGQSPREVGRALGMSEQSVAVLKRRALLRLRQSMAGL